MKKAIVNYWAGLQDREKWILIGGTLFVLLLIFHQLIWVPWHHAISEMQKSVAIKRTDLTWIRQQADLLEANGGDIPIANVQGKDQSLMSVIEQTARSVGVRRSIQQLTPRNNGREVSVVLEEASFNQWVQWADTLQYQYGVMISQLSAEREDKPDQAEIRVTFSRL